VISNSLTRNLVIFGAPLSYVVIGAVHPLELSVGDDPDLYIGIHFVQLFSIWGMALLLRYLIEGVDNRAARVARVAILPYAIVYSALDGMAGVAVGVLVRLANGMAIVEQQAFQRLLDQAETDPFVLILNLATAVCWLVAAVAAVLSLRSRAPAGALALLLIGAAIFAVGHPFPPGPIGMMLFIGGLAWLQLSQRQDEAVATSGTPGAAAAPA
jgi:cytochrome bd-type quinol oxidase subunit 2